MVIAYVDNDVEETFINVRMIYKVLKGRNIKVERIDTFHSSVDFLKELPSKQYDVIVLDIFMNEGEMTGIEIAEKIREQNIKTAIIFCSNSNDFAVESYLVNASYYIRKPLTENGIDDMVTRLNVNKEKENYVVLPDGKHLIVKDMICSEYNNHQITIFQKRGLSIKTWLSQKNFEEIISKYDFLQPCNKGMVVNLHEVMELRDNHFVMSDDREVPISRRKKSCAVNNYNDILFQRLRVNL